MRNGKRQDPGQTSRRSCSPLAQLPYARPSAEGGSPADTTTDTETSWPWGLAKSAPHERKQLCLRQQALSPSREAWGWLRGGPGCHRRGKVRGAKVMAGSNGARRGHVTRTRAQVSMFLGVWAGRLGRPLLCVTASWVWCRPLGRELPGRPTPNQGFRTTSPMTSSPRSSRQPQLHLLPVRLSSMRGPPRATRTARKGRGHPATPGRLATQLSFQNQVARLPRVPGPTQRGHLGPPPRVHVDTEEQGASPAAELGG